MHLHYNIPVNGNVNTIFEKYVNLFFVELKLKIFEIFVLFFWKYLCIARPHCADTKKQKPCDSCLYLLDYYGSINPKF